MKLVVLAGGTSTEREVSISSGTKVCQALQEKGHQAILVDVFCGRAEAQAETAFEELGNVQEAAAYMAAYNHKIEEMKNSRKEFFGHRVLELCRAADVVFLAVHGEKGEIG